MKKTLMLYAAMALACFGGEKVATENWVRRNLEAITGKMILDATISTNSLDNSITVSSKYYDPDFPEAVSVFLTFRSPGANSASLIRRKYNPSFWSLFVNPAFADIESHELKLLLMSGGYTYWSGGVSKTEMFNTGYGYEFCYVMDWWPIVPEGEHTCDIDSSTCICRKSGIDKENVPLPRDYRLISEKQFVDTYGDYAYWIDDIPDFLEAKTVGSATYLYLIDEGGRKHSMERVFQSDAWRGALRVVYEYDLKPHFEECQEAYYSIYICDKSNPQHIWGQWAVSGFSDCVIHKQRVCSRCQRRENTDEACNHPNKTSQVSYTETLKITKWTCSDCGHTWEEQEPNTLTVCNGNYHYPSDAGCGCKCGFYGSNGQVSSELRFHKHTSNSSCMCDCNTWHFYTSSSDPFYCDVCSTCKKRKKMNGINVAKADVDDHKLRPESDHKCGCRCGCADYSANGTDLIKFHRQMPNSCVCFGANGTGGRFHWPHSFGENSCVNICRYPRHGKYHLANLGEDPVKGSLVEAKPKDHTPLEDGACGCKCGCINSESSKADLEGFHNHMPYSCYCYCGLEHSKEEDGDDMHNWSDPSKCMCDCATKHKFVPNNPCPKVCASCKVKNNSGNAAEPSDHDVKFSGNECGCACRHFNNATGGAMPGWLHNRDDNTMCFCFCGADGPHHNWGPPVPQGPGPGGKIMMRKFCTKCNAFEDYAVDCSHPNKTSEVKEVTATAKIIHYTCPDCGYEWDEEEPLEDECNVEEGTHVHASEGCMCKCGRYHFYTSGPCHNVCGTCKTRTKDHTPTNAQDGDHSKASNGCGCKCGDQGVLDNIDFHTKNPNSCMCYCSVGSKGVHFYCPDSKCPGMCRYTVEGKRHRVGTELGATPGSSGSIVTGSGIYASIGRPEWHTPCTEADGKCGCKCQTFDENNIDQWGGVNFHVNAENYCGCFCLKDDYWKSRRNWHYFGPDDSDCTCHCQENYHRPWADEDCPNVCKKCGDVTNSKRESGTHQARPEDHSSAVNQGLCGCRCRAYSKENNNCENLSHDWHYMLTEDDEGYNPEKPCELSCQCGSVKTHIMQNPDECGFCTYCEINNMGTYKINSSYSDHKFGNACSCLCGFWTEHQYDDDKCECRCPMMVSRGHLWVLDDYVEGKEVVEPCELGCSGGTFEDEITEHCSRCQITNHRFHTYMVHLGPPCCTEGEEEKHSCGCGCDNCECESCKNGSGSCEKCQSRCDGEEDHPGEEDPNRPGPVIPERPHDPWLVR